MGPFFIVLKQKSNFNKLLLVCDGRLLFRTKEETSSAGGSVETLLFAFFLT